MDFVKTVGLIERLIYFCLCLCWERSDPIIERPNAMFRQRLSTYDLVFLRDVFLGEFQHPLRSGLHSHTDMSDAKVSHFTGHSVINLVSSNGGTVLDTIRPK